MYVSHIERRQRMRYTLISLAESDSAQINTLSRYEIKGCRIMHLFAFKPKANFALARE